VARIPGANKSRENEGAGLQAGRRKLPLSSSQAVEQFGEGGQRFCVRVFSDCERLRRRRALRGGAEATGRGPVALGTCGGRFGGR